MLRPVIPRQVDFSLSDSYAYCESVTRSSSSSFLRSFKHLPIIKRRSVYAIYAFCRKVDDTVDGDWLPNLDYLSGDELADLEERAEDRAVSLSIQHQSEPVNDDWIHLVKVRALIWFKDNLRRIREGDSVYHPIFIALQDTLNRFPIRIEDLMVLIEGIEDDLYPTNYRTFEDMRGYCYKVASTVGLVLIEIYGYNDPDAREHAQEMGIFLQMVNILRDINEDLERGRVYLPIDELELFGISTEQFAEPNLAARPEWRLFMRHYIHRARTHRNNGIRLIPLINQDSKSSPSVICAVYNEILREAERRNGDVLSYKLRLGFIQKIGLAVSTLLLGPPPIDRF